MKNRRTYISRLMIIAAMALIGCYISLTTGRTSGADPASNATPLPPTLHGTAAIKHLEQTGLYDSLSAAVTAARYRVEGRKEGGYEASNPEQDYRATFTREGMEVSGTSRTGDEWRMGMRLAGYGYGERKKAAPTVRLNANDDSVEYERLASEGGALKEWYVNRASGLEQGFTIPQAPGERRAGERLNLWLRLSGDLMGRQAGSGEAILLDGRGARLRYDRLHAFDATGRELESRMKVAGDEVKIEVCDEGAIYPVTIDPTLEQQAKLTAATAAVGDRFGRSVAISGPTAVVGVPLDDDVGPDSGSVYVFKRDGTSWSQQQQFIAGDAAPDDIFGRSVAISDDTIVVGSPGDDNDASPNSGSVYVFKRDGASWSQQQKLIAGDAAPDAQFGSSVAISLGRIVVGAALHNTAAGSAAGSAYVFVLIGTSWSQQQQLIAGDAAPADIFGNSVAISEDTIVVAAEGDDDAGDSSGSVYVFKWNGTSWILQVKLIAGDGAAGDNFGRSVAVSLDTIVVGAPLHDTAAGSDAGSVYVFVLIGTSWSQQQQLTCGDAAAGDRLGSSVGISGNTAVGGAPFDDTAAGSDVGSVCVFARSGTSWSQQQQLTAADAASADEFGGAVAISGDTVVVGSEEDDDAGDGSGSAYVFAQVAVAGYASTAPPGSAINAGSATVGSSTSAVLTISETGNATLQVASHSLSGPNAADFSVSPATLTIPDGGAPQDLAVTCMPSATGARTATLTVNHNAPDSPATYPLTCTGIAAGDPFADAVASGTLLVFNPGNAVDAPDGKVAALIGLLGIPALVLDMGEGEEGAGDLKVHYSGLNLTAHTTVDFLRANGSLISTGNLQLIDLSVGRHIAVAPYTGTEPYRRVRIRGLASVSVGVDAVEAVSIVTR